MNFILKHIRFIFFGGIFSCLLIFNNSCQTFDELQSDYLKQRDTIESLTNRVNILTEELIEQNAITSSLIENVSQLNEEVAENTVAASENSELLQGAINEVNGITGAVEDIEDNLENISYYIGDLIEESGDLSGDLNNLLNQVSRIDLITTDLYSTINNLDRDFHDHNDLDDLADLVAELAVAQSEIAQIRQQLVNVQAQVSTQEGSGGSGGSGGSTSEQTDEILGEWTFLSDPDTGKNSCEVKSIIFSLEDEEKLTFKLYTENEEIEGKFSISFDRSPFLIAEGTVSLLVSGTLIGTITDISFSASGTNLSANFNLDEYCVGQKSITYTSDVDLEDNTDTPDEDTENNSGGTPVEDAEDNTDTPVEDIEEDTENNTEIVICSDCPQKIPGYDIFIAGTSEIEGAVYWVNGQKNAIDVNSFASDITVDNGKVFVSGYTYGSTAKYWEINGQNIIQNNLPGFEGEAQSIEVKDNSVYVGGYYSHADGISGAYGCYWKDGVKYKNSGGGDHGASGIAVKSNGDVLTAGYFLNGHHYVIPAYWKNNTKSNLSTPGQSDGEAVTVKLRSNGTTVYGGIVSAPHNFLGSLTKPAYWVGSQRKSCNIGSVNDGWQNSGVHGLHLEGNTVYQAGWRMNMEGQYPTYWKNQAKYSLPGATVNGTRYDQGKATDIAIVDGKVVVVGMLTGAPLLNANGVQYDYGDGPVVNNDTGFPCIWIDGTIYVLDSLGDVEVGGFFIK